MSDFEDDLSDSQVAQPDPPKKQGLQMPKVSTPVLLGTTLAVLVGGVGAWWAINNANPAVVPPDPVTQTAPITPPDTTTPTTPTSPTTPDTSSTPNATTNGTGVEAGNIPLIASTTKPAAPTATTAAKPAVKPVVKPAPKPAAPKVLNPFVPLPQSGAAVAVVETGRQGAPVVQASFNPTVSVMRPTPTSTIPTPASAPPSFRLPGTPISNSKPNGSGVISAMKPVSIAVASSRPVIPKVAIITPAVSAQVKPRPVASTPIAQPSFSLKPPLLAAQPGTQAPIGSPAVNTPPSTTASTNPAGTRPNGVTQTPSPTATTRPAVSDPPIFKIEPAPTTRPTTPTTPPATSNPTIPSATTNPTPSSPNATPTNTTQPTVTTPNTPVATNNTTSNTNAVTTPVAPTSNPPAVAPNTNPATTTPATPPSTTPATSGTGDTTPVTPATDPASTTPNANTTPATPAAPSAELLELRRVVQDDLRLEYAGFSIGTVKKAFFQSNRGLLSVAEGEALVRDSNVVLKSVSPTEVVLALGNEVLTLPLVKR